MLKIHQKKFEADMREERKEEENGKELDLGYLAMTTSQGDWGN